MELRVKLTQTFAQKEHKMRLFSYDEIISCNSEKVTLGVTYVCA